MPIYEYKCKKCHKEFECLVLGSNDDIACPDCAGENVRRLISACSYKSGGNYTAESTSAGSSSCSGCSGKSCSTCH